LPHTEHHARPAGGAPQDCGSVERDAEASFSTPGTVSLGSSWSTGACSCIHPVRPSHTLVVHTRQGDGLAASHERGLFLPKPTPAARPLRPYTPQ